MSNVEYVQILIQSVSMLKKMDVRFIISLKRGNFAYI